MLKSPILRILELNFSNTYYIFGDANYYADISHSEWQKAQLNDQLYELSLIWKLSPKLNNTSILLRLHGSKYYNKCFGIRRKPNWHFHDTTKILGFYRIKSNFGFFIKRGFHYLNTNADKIH